MGHVPALSDLEIQRRLATLTGWQRQGNALRRVFTFAGFPEADGRKILGDNAVQFYGLDRDKLQQVADRIGPDASIFA